MRPPLLSHERFLAANRLAEGVQGVGSWRSGQHPLAPGFDDAETQVRHEQMRPANLDQKPFDFRIIRGI